jgi:Ca-activated chloride channel homolog
MELVLLRPWWLLALIPWLWLGWRLRRHSPQLSPLMRRYLLPDSKPAVPWRWWAMLPAIRALGGPALERGRAAQAAPPLDIWLLSLSRSMEAQDLAPDRATRVRLLLQDMLAQRQGQRIALILFAADAYLAMPATRDHEAIARLLPDLRPSIMPLQGANPERALALGLAQIPPGQSARLLLITDALTQAQARRIADHWPCQSRWQCLRQAGAPRLDILLAATAQPVTLSPELAQALSKGSLPAPDSTLMADLASRLGGQLHPLGSRPPQFAPLPTSLAPDPAHRQDLGPWLLLPLLLLALLARRGALWLALLLCLPLQPPVQAADPQPDQAEAQAAYQAGDYRTAAMALRDPIWRGNAWYRLGDFEQALAAYGIQQSPTAHYNRGNALVQLGRLEEAKLAYQACLSLDSGHHDARYNLALLERSVPPPQASPNRAPDESKSQPDAPAEPAPPVILLKERLRKEALRRGLQTLPVSQW